MRYDKLMAEIKNAFESWKDDPILEISYTEVELQKEFIKSVQHQIGSDLIVLTKDELRRMNETYYDSMWED
jgi:hypothetical protein